jgi:superfamily II DNA or RNA helicase
MLTVTPLAPEVGMGKPPAAFKAYTETQRAIYIPRFFDGVRLPAPAREPAAQQQPRLQFCGSLRPAQADIVAAGLQQCKQCGGGLLVLPTGFGKTVCALWLACALGVRTLVLAHKSFLLDQWAERIGMYVPQARIGRVQQKVVDVQDKDIVLGMCRLDCSSTAAAGGVVRTLVDGSLLQRSCAACKA